MPCFDRVLPERKMFEPKPGVSLHYIYLGNVEELLRVFTGSGIATTEIAARLFSEDGGEALRAGLLKGLAATGVKAASIHAKFGGGNDFSVLDATAAESAVAIACAALDLASEFDAPLVVMHASADRVPENERRDRIARARTSLARIGEHAKQQGRRVAVELLPRTCLGNTVDELHELLAGLDPDVFGVCLDVNHLMDRYAQLPEVVRRLGERLIALHLSDYDGVDEKHWMPGRGVIDWPAFMQALADIDYQGPFNYECAIDGKTCEERVQALEANFADVF